jgi:hypothetical protein
MGFYIDIINIVSLVCSDTIRLHVMVVDFSCKPGSQYYTTYAAGKVRRKKNVCAIVELRAGTQ